MARSAVRGGAKLKALLRNTRQAARTIPTLEVGFRDRRIAVLAGQLEFGNPDTSLPERPAFRNGVASMRKAVNAYVAKAGQGNSRARQLIGLTEAQWNELAIIARDAIRGAYLNFHGQPLSERQKARKEDTPFADDLLIGAGGPALIGHIKAYRDGVEIG